MSHCAQIFIETVDWFQIIIDLSRNGYTNESIAAAVGRSKASVQYWKSGGEPKYDDGARLIELWSTVTKNSQEFVPKVARQ